MDPMHENHDFAVPVNMLILFERAPFSWATRLTTMCPIHQCEGLQLVYKTMQLRYIN